MANVEPSILGALGDTLPIVTKKSKNCDLLSTQLSQQIIELVFSCIGRSCKSNTRVNLRTENASLHQ